MPFPYPLLRCVRLSKIISVALCWVFLMVAGCQTDAEKPATAVATINYASLLPTATTMATASPTPTRLPPTLSHFWEGQAVFVADVADTQLPPGESDTIVRESGEIWAYLHASERSNETIDQCGRHVPFPGCTVIYRSFDGGQTFAHGQPSVCQFSCQQCPCTSAVDHIEQQQYPRVTFSHGTYFLVYEYQAQVFLRRSADGLAWSQPEHVAYTGLWRSWQRPCAPTEQISRHPFVPYGYDCLAGGPPGIVVDDDQIYVFVGLGQSPGSLGCFFGPLEAPATSFQPCRHNPLITGAGSYGPFDLTGPETNAHFDFRMLSSAEILRVGQGEEARFYLLYEGIRGPGPGDPGDTQFGLGLARSETNEIDGRWQKYPHNPILQNLPGNIGLGHADLVVLDGRTYLTTSLDGQARTRLVLIWK